MQKKLTLLKSDWFSEINQKFDLIVSNPLHIKKSEIKQLSKEVRNFDPYVSINGGCSGLKAYEDIALNSNKFLNSEGIICVEIGKNKKMTLSKFIMQF